MTIIVRFSCMHIQCKVYKISDVLQQAKSSYGRWIQPGFQLLLLEVNRTVRIAYIHLYIYSSLLLGHPEEKQKFALQYIQ